MTAFLRGIGVPLMIFACAMMIVVSFWEYGGRWLALLGFGFLIVGIAPLIRSMWHLCRVEADAGGLWATRGRVTVYVPYERVVKVSSGSDDGWPKVHFMVRGSTELGKTITFVPIVTNHFSPGTPIARWLERKAREARRESKG